MPRVKAARPSLKFFRHVSHSLQFRQLSISFYSKPEQLFLSRTSQVLTPLFDLYHRSIRRG